MNNYNITISATQTDERLDTVLSTELNFTRAKTQRIIKSGLVSFIHNNKDEKILKCSHKVKEGDIYNITNIVEEEPTTMEAYDFALEVLFEDDYLLVINKPAGLVVHPGAGNKNNTLVNALLARNATQLSQVRGSEKQGIVHRLDKNTSGILLIAKQDYIHANLAEQFAAHSIVRCYRALVNGAPIPASGCIDNIIGRSQGNRQKMEVLNTQTRNRRYYALPESYDKKSKKKTSSGKRAITLFNTIKTSSDRKFSLIDCELKTGRTHQIRVHFSHLGHSIVGDPLYASARSYSETYLQQFIQLERQALHAYRLQFIHPVSGKELNFEQPEDEILEALYSNIFGDTSKIL